MKLDYTNIDATKLIMEMVKSEMLEEVAISHEKVKDLPKIKNGDPATDFTVAMLNNTNITLSDLKGKVVLLNFWTTTCAPCMREFKEIPAKVLTPFQNSDFVFISVSMGEDKEKVEKRMAQLEKDGVKFNPGLDPDKEISYEYAVKGVPSNFIIDKEGIIRDISSGFIVDYDAFTDKTNTSVDELAKEIKKLLNQ